MLLSGKQCMTRPLNLEKYKAKIFVSQPSTQLPSNPQFPKVLVTCQSLSSETVFKFFTCILSNSVKTNNFTITAAHTHKARRLTVKAESTHLLSKQKIQRTNNSKLF